MRKSLYMLAVATVLLVSMAVTGSGCKKKVTPPPAAPKVEAPPPAPAPPAPTISLSASPSTVERGQSATLSWNTSNASSVTIDGGVGTVEPSGSRSVSPTNSITYTAKASGPGGTANAETRITVTAPAPVAPPPPRAISDTEFFESRVKDAYFDYDKYDIREDARAALQEDARALAERSGIRFTIEGHCDERGSEKYNLALGDKRANAAKEFLVGQGVGGDRVETISYGEERQICTDHTEECWQKNRRAHFVLR
jgi:peptidoglycan-associated lipoprotein